MARMRGMVPRRQGTMTREEYQASRPRRFLSSAPYSETTRATLPSQPTTAFRYRAPCECLIQIPTLYVTNPSEELDGDLEAAIFLNGTRTIIVPLDLDEPNDLLVGSDGILSDGDLLEVKIRYQGTNSPKATLDLTAVIRAKNPEREEEKDSEAT